MNFRPIVLPLVAFQVGATGVAFQHDHTFGAWSTAVLAPATLVAPLVDAAATEYAPQSAVTLDWRILAGLDYTNGKATDTLRKLDGKVVRIPGFVVPLDDFQEEGAEFLLVPYYGACVHTPPPPPNQIVMVEMDGGKSVKINLFDAVWMQGRLKIQSVESPYGTVGYQLTGLKLEPYSSK